MVVRSKQLSGVRPEIYSRRIERVGRHALAIYSDVGILLRQTFVQRLPSLTAISTSVNAQLSSWRTPKFRALQRDYVKRFWLLGMNRQRKTKIGGQP